MVTLDDLRSVPETDAPDNRLWILWHRESGPYFLSLLYENGQRHAVLTRNATSPTCSRVIGSRIQLHNVNTVMLRAPLPENAPAGGPGLYAACIAALKQSQEPTPLRLRPGRSFAALERLLESLQMLARQSNKVGVPLNHIYCRWDPEVPILTWPERRRYPDIEDVDILEDVGEWFGPSSTSGAREGFRRDPEKDVPGPSIIEANNYEHNPTAHQLMQACALVAAFYQEAGPELGLTEDDIAARFRYLGQDQP